MIAVAAVTIGSQNIAWGQTQSQREATEAFRACRETEQYGDATPCWQRWLEKYRTRGHEAEIAFAEERIARASNAPSEEQNAPVEHADESVTKDSGPQEDAPNEESADEAGDVPLPTGSPDDEQNVAPDSTTSSVLASPYVPPVVLEDTPIFQLTPALGYGGATIGESGMTIAAFGLVRLSDEGENTKGIAFLATGSLGTPETGGVLGGFHVGDTVYFQLLGGLVVGHKEKFYDGIYGGFYAYETKWWTPAAGFALGIHGALTRVLGFNLEVFGIKGVDTDGLIAGVLIGPTFHFYRRAPAM